MNRKVNKPFKSYLSFLKTYLLRGFTFAKGGVDDDINPRPVPEEEAPKSDLNQNSADGPDMEPENDRLKEEAIMSPGRVAVRNYFRNPLGVIGLAMFIGIVVLIFGGSKLLPFDQYYSQGNLTNVAPGSGYMNYPSAMEEEGVEKISIGNTFSVGLTKDNNLYVWGADNEDNVLEIPEDIKNEIENKDIKDIAAGDRHILVATTDNEIYGWVTQPLTKPRSHPWKRIKSKKRV